MIAELLVDNDVLRKEVAQLKASNARLKKLYDEVALQLALLKKQLFGKKAERIDERQAQLAFDLVTGALSRLADGDESAADDAKKGLEQLRNGLGGEQKKNKPGHGRKPLSLTDLPVEEVVIEPAEVALADGNELEKIGEDVSEHIDRRPASLIRVRVIRPKYRVKNGATSCTSESMMAEVAADDLLPTTTSIQAEMPDRVLQKSNAGPGLLAHVLVSKFADHLPLHRQERIFKREGLALSTSTLSDWVQGSTALLSMIVDAMWVDAHDAPIVLSDATGVLVRAKEECSRAHFYVVVVPGRSVLFRFTRVNDGDTVAKILGGFGGKIQVDASSVYHELFRQNLDRIEVGCWAHARRKFYQCLEVDSDRAMIGIGFIGLLYDAHKASVIDGIVDATRRRELATPILDNLLRWLQQQREQGDSDTPIVKACNYLHNQWTPLNRFLDDGKLRLDNNPAELELRRQAVGRKNWLFVGSDSGAAANATAVSLIASCAMHGVEPWAYLRDVLTVLPAWKNARVIELAPHRWQKTREQPETKRLLEAQRLMGRNGDHGEDDAPKPALLS